MNREHRFNPKIGDYWHEMYTPVMIVLDVSDGEVVICDKTKPFDHDSKTWDFSTIRRLSREQFAAHPTYAALGSTHMGDKCWCDISPKSYPHFREVALVENAFAFVRIPTPNTEAEARRP